MIDDPGRRTWRAAAIPGSRPNADFDSQANMSGEVYGGKGYASQDREKALREAGTGIASSAKPRATIPGLNARNSAIEMASFRTHRDPGVRAS